MNVPPRRNAVRHAARWIALVAVTSATWLPIGWLSASAAGRPGGALEHGEFLATSSEAIPEQQSGWVPVTLPDDWRDRRPGVREGWYRFHVRARATDDPRWGVYLPLVMMNAASYVNGEPLGDGGRFDEPVARNRNRPLLFPFPADLLRAGDNTLHLRVASDLVDGGFLPVVHVGRLRDLKPAYDRAWFIRRTLLAMLAALRLVVAAFTAAIWVTWRKEAYYGWFALCAVAWVLAELDLMVIDIPMPTTAWYWLFSVAIGWWGICSVRLVLSFVRASKPAAERGLVIVGVAGSLGLALFAVADPVHFHTIGVNLWLTLTFLSSCYLFFGVVPLLRNYPDEIEFNVVFVVALSVVGCVLFDLVLQLGLRPRGGLAAPAYGSFVAVGGMGWVLVRRFVGALRESRGLAAALEGRVAEKHAELVRSYRQIAETDRARTLAEERQRILADMQDGLGGQLVSTLALMERPEVQQGELQRAVRSALEDLRLVIDSLDPADGEILPALGTLRSRMQPRFDAAGLTIEWHAEDVPPIRDLGPHKLLVLLRIVHDLFTAALQAPPGRTLTVRMATDFAVGGVPAAVIAVELGAAVDLRPIEERAREIGARIEARALERGGQSIRLSIPSSG